MPRVPDETQTSALVKRSGRFFLHRLAINEAKVRLPRSELIARHEKLRIRQLEHQIVLQSESITASARSQLQTR